MDEPGGEVRVGQMIFEAPRSHGLRGNIYDHERENLLASREYNVGEDTPVDSFSAFFPAWAEDLFRPVDDALISVCQWWGFRTVLFYSLSELISAVFTIELAVAFPFILYLVGQDGLAGEMAYLVLLTAVVSQVPKRFIYRYRPSLVRRALQCKNDTTSSFPARAVLVAVVFSYAAVRAARHWGPAGERLDDSEWVIAHPERIMPWMAWTFAGSVLATSFARVNLGAHYPSDCLVGAVLGVLVCLLSGIIRAADVGACMSCSAGACYSAAGSDRVLDATHFLARVNLPLVIGGAIASAVVAIGSALPPLYFWVKCHHVYGMLLPCILFRLTCLCPPLSPSFSSVQPPPLLTGATIAFSIVMASLTMVVGIFSRGSREGSIASTSASFFAIFAIVFVSLLVWRT